MHLHWLWVILPITLTSIAGPVIDVTGRMTALREDPAIRTRLMTLYTTIMFLLAGLGSALGTSTYAAFGWNGIVLASPASRCWWWLPPTLPIACNCGSTLRPRRWLYGSSQRPGA